jgi:2-oxoglutarate ferredoxin oxidoreductase subunit beta
MTTQEELRSSTIPDWCPGCGNYAILMSVKGAIADLGLARKDVVLVSGIGCSAKTPHYVKTYGFHAIHGRALPVASGIRLANHELTVLAHCGDGDCYGIGMGHFIHAMRRNVNITVIVHNNQIYGLTTGQTSPTSDPGFRSKSTPGGSIERAVMPLVLAIGAGGTFVARGFAGNPRHLKDLIVEGIKHNGAALIDVLQPCVTFNHVNTFAWFRERVYDLKEAGHDPTDRARALEKAFEWGDRIPIGVIYRDDRRPLEDSVPALEHGPLVKQSLERDIRPLMERFI